MQGPQGQPVPVQIVAVAEEKITIDANHPLAGQNLNFELELVEVN
jgi:FKBP-type peptidyl-prolyl cis-trans isomerase 2